MIIQKVKCQKCGKEYAVFNDNGKPVPEIKECQECKAGVGKC